MKVKVMAVIIALAGLCLANASGQGVDPRWTTYSKVVNTSFTFTATTAINTNLYYIDDGQASAVTIVNIGDMGGLLFFADEVQNAYGQVTNTYTYSNLGATNATTNTIGTLLKKYQSGKQGGIPIYAPVEVSASRPNGNIVTISPVSLLGGIKTKAFLVCTNTTSTSFTMNLSIQKKFN